MNRIYLPYEIIIVSKLKQNFQIPLGLSLLY